jgi:hypothetical protein
MIIPVRLILGRGAPIRRTPVFLLIWIEFYRMTTTLVAAVAFSIGAVAGRGHEGSEFAYGHLEP